MRSPAVNLYTSNGETRALSRSRKKRMRDDIGMPSGIEARAVHGSKQQHAGGTCQGLGVSRIGKGTPAVFRDSGAETIMRERWVYWNYQPHSNSALASTLPGALHLNQPLDMLVDDGAAAQFEL
ncbi:hypothetical protein ACVMIH_007411 [Bradyrhizobium sp. USDA 4503]